MLSAHQPAGDPRSNESVLDLRSGQTSGVLGVGEQEWRTALQNAAPDAEVGIRHAVISGTDRADPEQQRVHVAAIPNEVNCHFHRSGSEIYLVVEGQGVLHFAAVTEDRFGAKVRPQDWRQQPVKQGDYFVIPEGFAHQLRRSGNSDLTILFACPDSHLNSRDRTILPAAPR